MSGSALVRVDGRRPDELRPVKITRNFIKYAEGSVLIEMGETKVICTVSFVALADAVAVVRAKGLIKKNPLRDYLAAVSVGKVGGELLADLCYAEDSLAEVDLNLVMTGKGQFVEIQGTAEKWPFTLDELNKFLTLGWHGISALVKLQQELVGDLR